MVFNVVCFRHWGGPWLEPSGAKAHSCSGSELAIVLYFCFSVTHSVQGMWGQEMSPPTMLKLVTSMCCWSPIKSSQQIPTDQSWSQSDLSLTTIYYWSYLSFWSFHIFIMNHNNLTLQVLYNHNMIANYSHNMIIKKLWWLVTVVLFSSAFLIFLVSSLLSQIYL